MPKLEQIVDWGALKTEVLEQEDFMQYQAVEEVGRAVRETAVRVVKKNPRKWDADRDRQVAEWLEASAVQWANRCPVDGSAVNPLLEKINTFTSPADYDRSLDLTALDLECCRSLIPLFKRWSWDKKRKAKASNHKLWQRLQRRIKELKE